MSKPEFVFVSYIAAPIDKVFAALTRGEFTKLYWYNRRLESDWTVGAPLKFYDGDSDTVTDSGQVVEFDPPRRLVYTFRPEFSDDVKEQFGTSRVSFTLEAKDEGVVKLTLVHDELPSQEMADAFREGWAPILSSLKTYLETGKPLPQLRQFEEQGKAR
ncbi:MAG TPA: SRPBCC family protein [Thermoanaerobaculia bacterium]|nr:SRPBCC family protein [Thermoanaerobaculia bacterium]